MERILCTNGKRDDYFENQVATSANFTKKTVFWIKETVEQLPKETKPKAKEKLKNMLDDFAKEPADALNTPLINPAKELSTTDFKTPIIETNFESL